MRQDAASTLDAASTELARKRMDVGKPLRAASDGFPIMTAAVKKAVGKKSAQNTSFSSRKTVSPLFRIGRGPKNTEKNGLVCFGKSSEK
jgi:hypothetical protein